MSSREGGSSRTAGGSPMPLHCRAPSSSPRHSLLADLLVSKLGSSCSLRTVGQERVFAAPSVWASRVEPTCCSGARAQQLVLPWMVAGSALV